MSGWISVKERYPKDGAEVLATAGKKIRQCHFFVWDNGVSFGALWRAPVSHWMPLPKPPKEEK